MKANSTMLPWFSASKTCNANGFVAETCWCVAATWNAYIHTFKSFIVWTCVKDVCMSCRNCNCCLHKCHFIICRLGWSVAFDIKQHFLDWLITWLLVYGFHLDCVSAVAFYTSYLFGLEYVMHSQVKSPVTCYIVRWTDSNNFWDHWCVQSVHICA